MIDRIRDAEALETSVQAAREQALEFAATAKERFAQGSSALKTYTIEQPARALGLALGMGVLLGWLIKRR